MIKVKKDDIVDLSLSGEFDVVIHCCNCFCTETKGSSFDLFSFFQQAFLADKKTVRGDVYKLGEYSNAIIKKDVVKAFTLYNLYCQFKPINSFEYTAFGLGLRNISENLKGIEKIGIAKPEGIYGIDFNIIKSIVSREIGEFDVTIIVPI
jgi:hypothetical protein